MLSHTTREAGCGTGLSETSDLAGGSIVSENSRPIESTQADLPDLDLPPCLVRAVPASRLGALAAEIRTAHAQVGDAAKRALESAVEAGRCLIEAKKLVEHGEWLPWLEQNCGVSERTAQLYMRLCRELPRLDPAKAQRVADLSLRAAIAEISEPCRQPETPTQTSLLAEPLPAVDATGTADTPKPVNGIAAVPRPAEAEAEAEEPDDDEPEPDYERQLIDELLCLKREFLLNQSSPEVLAGRSPELVYLHEEIAPIVNLITTLLLSISWFDESVLMKAFDRIRSVMVERETGARTIRMLLDEMAAARRNGCQP